MFVLTMKDKVSGDRRLRIRWNTLKDESLVIVKGRIMKSLECRI